MGIHVYMRETMRIVSSESLCTEDYLAKGSYTLRRGEPSPYSSRFPGVMDIQHSRSDADQAPPSWVRGCHIASQILEIHIHMASKIRSAIESIRRQYLAHCVCVIAILDPCEVRVGQRRAITTLIICFELEDWPQDP